MHVYSCVRKQDPVWITPILYEQHPPDKHPQSRPKYDTTCVGGYILVSYIVHVY